MAVIKRFEVWLFELDPTKGSEIKKTRPCLVVSPDPTNKYLNTITVVPMQKRLGIMDEQYCKATGEVIVEAYKCE